VKRWGLILILVVGLLLGGSYLYAYVSRTNELKSLLARLPGSQIVAGAQVTSSPSLLRDSAIRRWDFAVSEEQRARLKALCRENARSSPPSSLDRTNGCVASYDLDRDGSRYSTLTIRDGTATITSVGMSRTDLDTLALPVSKNTDQ
jgi:hypothetical protein